MEEGHAVQKVLSYIDDETDYLIGAIANLQRTYKEPSAIDKLYQQRINELTKGITELYKLKLHIRKFILDESLEK